MSKELEEIMKKAYETGALTDTEFRKAITDLFLEEDEYIIDTGNFENVNAEFVLRLKGKHRKLHKIFWNDKFAEQPNSTNLLMQELDCKDFAELRKYARCGYERLNNFKGSKEVKIEIPESSLMDYNPVKHYLKWEDLEFKEAGQKQIIKVKKNDNLYILKYYISVFDEELIEILANDWTFITGLSNRKYDKQFFNDLHLERVEE